MALSRAMQISVRRDPFNHKYNSLPNHGSPLSHNVRSTLYLFKLCRELNTEHMAHKTRWMTIRRTEGPNKGTEGKPRTYGSYPVYHILHITTDYFHDMLKADNVSIH